jgi:hypothetical protein
MLGHPEDCPCCSVRIARTSGSKRGRADADLTTFLPEANEEPGEEEPEEEEEAEEGEEPLDALIHETLFKSFEAHVERLDAARRRRIETLSFKSALEDDGKEEINEDASQDEIDGLGVWLPGDEFQGDVNYRTLQKLLTRVDQRGFERSAQQLEFHVAFMKAAARVIYRGSWETERPAIMKKYGWETSNSEVLISTPRRFGKTFRCVPRVPACQRLRQPRARVLWQHCHLLRLPRARIRPRDRRLQPSPTRVPQAARTDRRASSGGSNIAARKRGAQLRLPCAWQVCATVRRRQAHLRVQPGGVPPNSVRWAQEPDQKLSVRRSALFPTIVHDL